MKIVLLIIASQGYQPTEYGYTRRALEEAGIKVEVASNSKAMAFVDSHAKPCNCKNKTAEYQSVNVDFSLAEVNVDNFDGIFIIGGPGALQFLDNPVTYSIIQTAAHDRKFFGAICISPRILAHAGVLNDKKATGWDEDGKLASIFKEYNVTYVKEPVVVDGNIITATGPSTALAFGKAIGEQLKL